jgi:hypothetical protein
MTDSKKVVFLDTKTAKTVKTEKPKTKRVITEDKKWDFTKEELDISGQYSLLGPLFEDQDISTNRFVKQQIKNKISGYKGQDTEKSLLDVEKFVDLDTVLALFKTSQLKCYYCKDPTFILYEYVRDPKQWTLERIDNSFGHNCDNVVLACLRCNLRRRCIDSERYVKTKQMATIIKCNSDS